MAAYVDNAAIMWKGKARFHLSADSVPELHAFAASIGVKRCWWHSGSKIPHYDITGPQREAAIEAGAQALSTREFARVMRDTYRR